MLNHASWVNHENSDRKYEATKGKNNEYDYYQSFEQIEDDPVVMNGKRMSQLSEEELETYLTDWKGFGN